MKIHRNPTTPSRPTCWAAGLLALWVFLLGLGSASPDLHEWLHADPDCSHSEHRDSPDTPDAPTAPSHVCAITFLQGGVLLADCIALPAASLPRLLLQPEEIRPRPALRHIAFYESRAPPIELVV